MRASARPLAATTFVEVLRLRAEETPDAVGYVFLGDDDGLRQMTYGSLDLRSRTLAANLQQLGLAGERVLIVHPPGLDYVAAFFGCMYAGCVPVPAYPPDGRTDRGIERLHAVAASASPRAIVTTSHLAQRLRDVANAAGRSDLLTLVSPVADESLAATWRAPATSAADLAFLQYSSGSTGSPKGVCLSQANLMHNSELIRRAFGHDRTSRGVIWLPPYHDMGLIGGILQPLYVGFPVLLFSPVTFLLRPARWLRAVSAFRATTSGGPNFAYDICVRRVTEAEKDGLDLSSWDVAFTGAEPVRSATLERFTRAFERCGFRREALQPCYGLAEATLIVSGGEKGRGPVALTLSREQLEGHYACQAHDREPSEQVVACGRVMDDMELAIVDAENGTPLPDGRVGEIWVRGPSVAGGYWRLPEENAATFEGRLRGDAGPAFLRTGDLGFQREGRLYITGRLKDLIIVRGRNLYPQDVEAAAETSHPLLRPGGGAAFSVERDGEERLVVVHEVHRHFKPEAGGDVRDAVRAAISETFEVAAWAVELIRPASLPRTSSGKVRRGACRDLFLTGRLASCDVEPAIAGGEEDR